MREQKNHQYAEEQLQRQQQLLIDARWTNIAIALVTLCFALGGARWVAPAFDTPAYVYGGVVLLGLHAFFGEWILWKWLERRQTTRKASL